MNASIFEASTADRPAIGYNPCWFRDKLVATDIGVTLVLSVLIECRDYTEEDGTSHLLGNKLVLPIQISQPNMVGWFKVVRSNQGKRLHIIPLFTNKETASLRVEAVSQPSTSRTSTLNILTPMETVDRRSISFLLHLLCSRVDSNHHADLGPC